MAKSETLAPLIIHRLFNHKCSDLFGAFSSSKAIEQWFSPSADIAIRVDEYNFHAGGRYKIIYTLQDDGEATLKGKFIRINPPEELCLTWMWEHDEPAGISSLVTINFIEKGSKTELIITHEQLVTNDETVRHRQGWLDSLKRLDRWLATSLTN